MKNISNCKICDNKLKGRQKIFCSSKCKNKAHQSYSAQKKRGIVRKLYFVNKLGGKCSKCNYAKNLASLAFHHLSDKKFQLDVRSLSNRKIDLINAELAKCIILCHNCHAEIHNPDKDLVKLLIEPTALTTELHPQSK